MSSIPETGLCHSGLMLCDGLVHPEQDVLITSEQEKDCPSCMDCVVIL